MCFCIGSPEPRPYLWHCSPKPYDSGGHDTGMALKTGGDYAKVEAYISRGYLRPLVQSLDT